MENQENLEPGQPKNNKAKKILILAAIIFLIVIFFLVIAYLNGAQIVNN